MPINRRIIGLVSLPQRCGRARASAGTFGSRREPTPMRTTLVLRRTMRVTSPCTHSDSFPDLTCADRRPTYAQYGHSRHRLPLYCQQARRWTILHNGTLDLAKSLRLLALTVKRGVRHLEMLAAPKTTRRRVKITGLRSISAVRDGSAKGAVTLHRRDRRELFFPRGLRAYQDGKLAMTFRTGSLGALWIGP